MNNTIQYKGYIGSVEFSKEDGVFFGKVMGIRSLISYEGSNAKELLDDFHGAVDDYLEMSLRENRIPFEIAHEPDPFYSETNLAHVKRSIQELRAGKGTVHDLIEVDDE